MDKLGWLHSLERALGMSAFKQSLARKTGIPNTKEGLERKNGKRYPTKN
jgi:hypothetical protein